MNTIHISKFQKSIFFTAAIFFAAFACHTHAATITWTNNTGNWSTPANWSPNSVPATNDTAVIPSGVVTLDIDTGVGGIILGTNGPGATMLLINSHVLTLDGALTVNPSAAFTVDSGTLVGNTNAVLNGPIGWTAGLLGGTLTLANGGTLTISTVNNHDMPNCVFTNNGIVAWASGDIRSGGSSPGTFIYNYGLWNAQSDQQLTTAGYNGFTTFNNYGTFRKSAGSSVNQTVFAPNVALNQLSGTLDIEQGNLSLQGSANLTGGYISTNSTGTTILALGNFNLNGTVTGTNVVENGGAMVGNNVINGALQWLAGTWNGISTMTVLTNSTLTIAGGTGNNDLPNCILTNSGTVQWVSGDIRSGGSAPGTFIYNYGLWNAQSDHQLTTAGYNGATVFNNYGTFRKSGGTNTSQTLLSTGIDLNQLAGAVDVQQGNLTLQGTGNFTGGTANDPAGTIILSLGTYTINGTAITNFIEESANLSGTNNLNGGFTWVGGTWNSTTITIPIQGLITIAGGNGNNDMANTVLTNYGSIVWTSGDIRNGGSAPGTLIDNYGLWDIQCDHLFTTAGYNGATVFNNYGNVRKEVTSGTTTFSTGTAFNSTGQVSILTGTLLLQGSGNFPSGTLNIQTAGLNLQGGGSFTGVALTNTGTIYLDGGNFTINNTSIGTNTVENGGNLVGTNIINGDILWISGNWDTAVVMTTPNSIVTITNDSFDHDMANCIFTNYGDVIWNSGEIRSGGSAPGTFIYNYGLWNAQNDQQLTTAGYNGNTVFYNYGTFRKSGGSGEFASATIIDAPVVFNQLGGVLDVQNGTNGLQLAFEGGGSFTGGYITTNQFGLTVLGLGNYNLNGTITGTNTWENGGNLTGTCVINSALTWLSGNWDNAPTMNIPTNATLIIISANNHDMANCTLTNKGSVIWNSGDIRSGGSAPGTFIYNYGLWTAQSDQQLTTAGYNGDTVFNNYGTFRKSAGTNTSQTLLASPVFYNQPIGVLDIQQGNFILQGGGNFNGGYITTNSAGTTTFSLGNFNLNGTATGSNVIENAGNLIGTNVIQGALEWFAGNWDNAPCVTVTTNSSLLIISANNHDMANCILTNNGTIVWNTGDIRSGGSAPGTFIYNYGLWNAQSDQQLTTAGYNGLTTLNNYGIFRKSAGTNTLLATGIQLNQLAGALDIEQGSLTLQGNGSFSGGTANNPAGTIYLAIGNDNINGTATANMIETTASLTGTNVINGGFTWMSGVWNGITMTILTNSFVTIAGGTGNDDMANTIVTNYGTLAWSSGDIRSGGSAPGTFVYNYGLWDAQSDHIFTTAGYNGATVFNNYGTFRKEASTGTTAFQTGVDFVNTGKMDAESGDIALQASYTLVNGTAMNFGLNGTGNNGQITLSGPASFTGSASAHFNQPLLLAYRWDHLPAAQLHERIRHPVPQHQPAGLHHLADQLHTNGIHHHRNSPLDQSSPIHHLLHKENKPNQPVSAVVWGPHRMETAKPDQHAGRRAQQQLDAHRRIWRDKPTHHLHHDHQSNGFLPDDLSINRKPKARVE